MIIRQMQPHPAAVGDVEHFLQVLPGAGEVAGVAVQRSAGEQTEWQILLLSCCTQTSDSLL